MRASSASHQGIRLALLALALGVATWSAWIWRTPATSPSRDDLVQQLSVGETFSREDLDRLALPCAKADETARVSQARLVSALAAVQRAEDARLYAGEKAARTSCAAAAVRAFLRLDPASSLGWYLLARVSLLEGDGPDRTRAFLERSVILAPRELSMAVRRRPLMEVGFLSGRTDLIRSDYRTLAEGERSADAAFLLRDCLARDPVCGVDWNVDLPSRYVSLVQGAMVKDR